MSWCKPHLKVASFVSGVVFLALLVSDIGCESSGTARQAKDDKTLDYKNMTLVDFEDGIPCSECSDAVGFRRRDKDRGRIVSGGAEGTAKSAIFRFSPNEIDIYIQGDVRRKYLLTKSEKYVSDGPNLLTFWVKLPPDSPLIGREEDIRVNDKIVGKKKNNQDTMRIMTYHWRQGDLGVGGKTNNALTTDSNMHGYSDFRFNEKAAGKWVRVALSPSAFRQGRNYYHFYAANAVTDDLNLFSSLRQLQFRIMANLDRETNLQLDEIKFAWQQPTAIFDKGIYRATVSVRGGDYNVPVTIRNPTQRDRRYRVFISSFIGAEREYLNKIFALTDDLFPMRGLQARAGADGGIGAAELVGPDGTSVSGKFREISIPAGGVWNGKLVHHLKPQMHGDEAKYSYRDYDFHVRRDTLTTSVIVWDPADPVNGNMDFLSVNPSNADDGNHFPPPGFPRQTRLPEGWRSEDIPLNQVGGYFVSVLTLIW